MTDQERARGLISAIKFCVGGSDCKDCHKQLAAYTAEKDAEIAEANARAERFRLMSEQGVWKQRAEAAERTRREAAERERDRLEGENERHVQIIQSLSDELRAALRGKEGE